MDGKDTGHPSTLFLFVGQVVGFEVASVQHHDVPNDGEPEPTEEETQRKNEQNVSPLDVQHGVEKVGKVSPFSEGGKINLKVYIMFCFSLSLLVYLFETLVFPMCTVPLFDTILCLSFSE